MKTANWIIKFRWVIIIGFILLTALMAIQMPNAKIEPDLKEALPKHMKSKVNTDKTRRRRRRETDSNICGSYPADVARRSAADPGAIKRNEY